MSTDELTMGIWPPGMLEKAVASLVPPTRQELAALVWSEWSKRFETEDMAMTLTLTEPGISRTLFEDMTRVRRHRQPDDERPVILRGLIDDWEAFEQWTTNQRVDVAKIAKSIGAEVVVPADDIADGKRYYLKVKEVLGEDWGRYYLKDFVYRRFEDLKKLAPTPKELGRYRNWLSDDKDVGYNFLYVGPRGSRTALHADVANSISWSAAIAGRKKWRLLPPEQTPFLFDATGRHLAKDFAGGDGVVWGPCRCSGDRLRCFPNLGLAKPMEIVQEPGEVIVVPSGWYHTVDNLDDALSVNANVLDATNVLWVLSRLEKSTPDKPTSFGGDDLSAQAFLAVLLDAIRHHLQRPNSLSPDDLLEIQRAAAVARLLASDLLDFRLVLRDDDLNLLSHTDDLLTSRDAAPSTILLHHFATDLATARRRLSPFDYVL